MEKDICPLYYTLMSGLFHTLPTPVRKGYTFEGWYTSANGGSKVTEKTVCNTTKDVTVYARWAEIYVTKIAIESYPNTTSYYIGDNVSVIGGTVKATYNDGSTKNVAASHCEVSYPDMGSEGTKNVKLTYGNKETTYMISVKSPSISIIGGSNGNDTSKFAVNWDCGNQQFINIIWSSSNTSVATVSQDGMVNASGAGEVTITASFNYNNKKYYDSKKILVNYSEWSDLSALTFNRETTSNLKKEVSTELYYYYYFKCPNCGAHSSQWSITCKCGTYIPFDGVKEIHIAHPYNGMKAYEPVNLSGEAIVKYNNGIYLNETIPDTLVYVHNTQTSKTAYRYQTRKLQIFVQS